MSAVTSLFDENVDRLAPSTTLIRMVALVCPHCGEERTGAHVDSDDGPYVECHGCGLRHDVSVLKVPTSAVLETWRADAVLRGSTALLCADGLHGCSYLAMASCRRLADELSPIGKTRLLGQILRAATGELTQYQRSVAIELGVALGLTAAAINATIALA